MNINGLKDALVADIQDKFPYFVLVDKQKKYTSAEIKLPAVLIGSGDLQSRETTSGFQAVDIKFQAVLIAKESELEGLEDQLYDFIKYIGTNKLSRLNAVFESAREVSFEPELPGTVSYIVSWNQPLVIK